MKSITDDNTLTTVLEGIRAYAKLIANTLNELEYIDIARLGDSWSLPILVAVLFDAYLGGPRRKPPFIAHPHRIASSIIAWFEPRLNRPQRSAATRANRGLLLVLILFMTALPISFACIVIKHVWDYGWFLETAILFSCVSLRSPLVLLSRASFSCQAAMHNLTQQLRDSQDHYARARLAIEEACHRLVLFGIAPLFWYVLAGLTGLIAFVALSMFEKNSDSHRTDGTASSAFNLWPQRLIALSTLAANWGLAIALVFASIFLPQAYPRRAFQGLKDLGSRKPLAVLAGALDIALGGPRHSSHPSWIGHGRGRVKSSDIRRSTFLLAVATILLILMLAVFALLNSP